MRASVKARITFLKEGLTKTFTGLADAGPDNCTDEFGRFPVAMAETRAKGRVLSVGMRSRDFGRGEARSGRIADPSGVQSAGNQRAVWGSASRGSVVLPAGSSLSR